MKTEVWTSIMTEDTRAGGGEALIRGWRGAGMFHGIKVK